MTHLVPTCPYTVGLQAIVLLFRDDFPPIPYGLVVRIRGFHPRGPGSIPGMGIFCILYDFSTLNFFISICSQKIRNKTNVK